MLNNISLNDKFKGVHYILSGGNMKENSCLNKQDVLDYQSGLLNLRAFIKISKHAENCDGCQKTINRMRRGLGRSIMRKTPYNLNLSLANPVWEPAQSQKPFFLILWKLFCKRQLTLMPL